VGFAVLDLVTGKVERHEVQTRFGLAPQSLTWLNTSTLAMVADHFASLRPNDYAGRTRTYFFDVGSPSSYSALAPATVLDIPVRTWPAWVCAPVCPGRYAEMVGDRRLRVFRSGENSSESDIRFSAPATSVVYDPHHHLVAATEGNIDVGGPTAGPLVVGRVDHGRVGFTSVPGGRSYQQVMTWVDPAHVTTMRQTLHGLVYDLVDVRTGARRPLVSKPWYAFTIAADALQRPSTVPGIAPPSPWNPRWVALGALGALLLAGGAVVVVRRSHVRG
jgi:hypothetical protein